MLLQYYVSCKGRNFGGRWAAKCFLPFGSRVAACVTRAWTPCLVYWPNLPAEEVAAVSRRLSYFSLWFRHIANIETILLVTFKVLTAASMKISAFWDIVPCSLVRVDRRFRAPYCLYHQSPWWWRQYTSPKRESTPTLHGAISQQALVFILLVILHGY
jgi:hypothetical protein